MKVNIRRYDHRKQNKLGSLIDPTTLKNCHFDFTPGMRVMLSGPRFRYLADGDVKDVATPYPEADYDLFLQVWVSHGNTSRMERHLESWYITFLEPAKEKSNGEAQQ